MRERARARRRARGDEIKLVLSLYLVVTDVLVHECSEQQRFGVLTHVAGTDPASLYDTVRLLLLSLFRVD